ARPTGPGGVAKPRRVRGWLRRPPPAAPADTASKAPSGVAAGPGLDLASNDPLVGYLLSAASAVDITHLQLQSPALAALQDAGVVLVVPLISSGSLVGLLSLGPRRSERGYSTDDLRLLNSLAGYAAPALGVGPRAPPAAGGAPPARAERAGAEDRPDHPAAVPAQGAARPAQLACGRLLPAGPHGGRGLLRLHPAARRAGHVRGRGRERQGHPGCAGHCEHARASPRRRAPAHLAGQGPRPRQRHAVRGHPGAHVRHLPGPG